MTQFPYRYIIVVDANKKAMANGSANSWDPDAGGNKTFDTANRLSANGAEPASHLLVETVANEAMRSGIQTAYNNIPFVELYSIHPGGEHAGWTREDVLADLGLQLIQEEL